jgi:phosphoenolpyruvate carboxykinase (GTP)
VNWFRKDAAGKFLWPGFGENIRVLEWIFERTAGRAEAAMTPIGYVPKRLNLSGLEVSQQQLQELLSIDPEAWKKEVEELKNYFSLFGTHLPEGIAEELSDLQERVKKN